MPEVAGMDLTPEEQTRSEVLTLITPGLPALFRRTFSSRIRDEPHIAFGSPALRITSGCQG